MQLRISGEIKSDDEKQLVDNLKRLRKGGRVSVFIKSDGGDIQTAVKIGRILRQYEADVRTSSCLSSCVLVLIGGVTRGVDTNSALGMGVGLHRIYFANLPPNLSTPEITQKREQLRNEVATYIKEMNISGRLLDLMEAIPPEKMKMLTKSEVSDLGLDAPDPVWDEKRVANSAKYYGITSAEYRQRDETGYAKCAVAFDNNASPEAQLESSQNNHACREAVLYGLTIKDYWLRNERYEAWSKAYFENVPLTEDGKVSPQAQAFGLKCLINIMKFNAQTCDK